MFIISERQYHLIMKHVQSCYPRESGGFLGGRDNTILGVLPIPNKKEGDQTENFVLTNEDIELAFRFLVKHRLEFMGVYHSHPRGVPFPSPQDLSHNQKHLFIIGLSDRYNPELYAWTVENGQLFQEDIKIMSDYGITVVDIASGQPKLAKNAPPQMIDRLAHTIDDMIKGKPVDYQKSGPSDWDAGTFSTLA